MSDFDKIILAEKERHYQMVEQDQFVFETLYKVQHSKIKPTNRLLVLTLVIVISVALAIQLLFLQTASFESLTAIVKTTLATKPYYLALFNLGIVGFIVFIRRSGRI